MVLETNSLEFNINSLLKYEHIEKNKDNSLTLENYNFLFKPQN